MLVLASLGALAGLLGTVVPLLPGLPLIVLSVGLYAAVTRFTQITGTTILVLIGITVGSFLLETWVIAHGIRRVGGTRRGMLGGIIGATVGLLIASLPGLLFGLLLGVIIGESTAGTEPGRIGRATMGAFLGLLASTAVRFVLGIAMVSIALIDFFRS